MKSSFVWITALMILGTALVVQSFQGPQASEPERVTATYTHGVLRVAIPYVSHRAGKGRLTVEVLDPEDLPLAKVERVVEIGGQNGTWHEDAKLTKAIRADDLVWHRVHYRFGYEDGKNAAIEGTESV